MALYVCGINLFVGVDVIIIIYFDRVKTSIKTMKGVRRGALPSYLDEFMWRERYGDNVFYNLLNKISLKHPLS